VVCIAYLSGVLGAQLPIAPGAIAIVWITLGLLLSRVLPLRWRAGPDWRVWCSAGLIAALAVGYVHLSQPHPSPQDIHYHQAQLDGKNVVIVGRITEPPGLTRKQKIRLILQVEQLNGNANIAGKVYATIPLLHGTGLVPGQQVQLLGKLYDPPLPSIPGGFDFRAYLRKQGIFTGFTGQLMNEPTERPGGLWQIRQRIVRALVEGLGSPSGFLVAGMVLGRKAVDLALDVQTQFIQVGLAHTLAASGFHVSVLVGMVKGVTGKLPQWVQLVAGIVTLVVYVSLTGFQASVVRAALMGVVGLVALVMGRRVRSLGLILVTATVLLLVDPLWIVDVGFQLSFMATVGLILVTPWVMARFEQWGRLPPAVATLVAVPVGALVWTLPLLIYHFNTVSPYSIVVNIITTPLILIISVGGFASGVLALISPVAGSYSAMVLGWPVLALRAIVAWFYQLPGSLRAVGSVELWQVGVMYGLWIMLCWAGLRQWRRWGVILAGLLVLVVPLGYQRAIAVHWTLLDTAPNPVLLIQDRGAVGLVGTGDRDVIEYQLTPALQQAGVNALDTVLLLRDSDRANLPSLRNNRNLGQLWATSAARQGAMADPETSEAIAPLAPNQTLQLRSTTVTNINADGSLLWLHHPQQTWLFILAPQAQWPTFETLPDAIVVTEEALTPDLFARIPAPLGIILSRRKPDPDQTIPAPQTRILWTSDTGLVQWTQHQGLSTAQSSLNLE
jgi:competence protein ComEC